MQRIYRGYPQRVHTMEVIDQMHREYEPSGVIGPADQMFQVPAEDASQEEQEHSQALIQEAGPFVQGNGQGYGWEQGQGFAPGYGQGFGWEHSQGYNPGYDWNRGQGYNPGYGQEHGWDRGQGNPGYGQEYGWNRGQGFDPRYGQGYGWEHSQGYNPGYGWDRSQGLGQFFNSGYGQDFGQDRVRGYSQESAQEYGQGLGQEYVQKLSQESVQGSVQGSVQESILQSVQQSVQGNVRESVPASVQAIAQESIQEIPQQSIRENIQENIQQNAQGSGKKSVQDNIRESVQEASLEERVAESKADVTDIHGADPEDFLEGGQDLVQEAQAETVAQNQTESALQPYMVYRRGEQGMPAIDRPQALRMEMDYFKSLYPQSVRKQQVLVEEVCDHLDYDGSPMYDEYPDRVSMFSTRDRVCRNAREAGIDDNRDLAQLLLVNEMNRRRFLKKN